MTRKQVSEKLVEMRNGRSAIDCGLTQHVLSAIENASSAYSLKNMIVYANWLGYNVFVHNLLMDEYYRLDTPMDFSSALSILMRINHSSLKEINQELNISFANPSSAKGPFPSIDMALRILGYFESDISFIRKRPDLDIVVRNTKMKIETA